MTLSLLLAILALGITAGISLGRQFTVFTVFTPGLWFFCRYPLKRNVSLLVALALIGVAALLGPLEPLIPLLLLTALLAAFAILFNLNFLFPALSAVRVVYPEEADLAEQQPVMLLEVNGERRAYPLAQMVIARHLVHDVVGGMPVAVTYCALCRSGLAFRAEVDGRPLQFTVVGIFRRNLIMEDDQTHTLWQQATGTAIYGPHAGRSLEILPAWQLPWNQARQETGLTLATDPPGIRRPIFASARGFALLKKATERVMTPGRTRLSGILPPRETVFGVHVNGAAKAYPLSRLQAGSFTDQVGGVPLTFTFDPVAGTLTARRSDGQPDPIVEKHWWLGWQEFNPETAVDGD
jgi:hypothetical protein